MLSAPQVDQAETYTLKQLNNVLNLAFHYIDFKMPLLFKTDPDDKSITNFKTELLPLLNNCSISAEQFGTFDLAAQDFMTKFNAWIAEQDSFNMSYLMTGLIKQVFKKCNLLDFSVIDYQLKIDMRANAIREQFHQLVVKKLAKNLVFDSDGNTPLLFEKNSRSAILSERCFTVMIAELTQVGHSELAEALHNILHLAKHCSSSDSAYNMSTFQLAATYSPCFLTAFDLEDKIYTKQNGFTDEECARIGRQWKLMTIVLTHTLESNWFDIPYILQKPYYEKMDIPPLLPKAIQGLPAMMARSNHVTALDLVISRHYLIHSELASPSSELSGEKHSSSSSNRFLSSFSRLARGKKHSKSKEAAEPKTGHPPTVQNALPLASILTTHAVNSSSDESLHNDHKRPPFVRTASFFKRNKNVSSPTQDNTQTIPPLFLEKVRDALRSTPVSEQYQTSSARGTSTDPDLSPDKSSIVSMLFNQSTPRLNSDRDRVEDDSSLHTADKKNKIACPRKLLK